MQQASGSFQHTGCRHILQCSPAAKQASSHRGCLDTLGLSTQLQHAALLQHHTFQCLPAAVDSRPPLQSFEWSHQTERGMLGSQVMRRNRSMPEECGTAGTCWSAVNLRIWAVQQGPEAGPSSTQAAPDHPAWISGPAGKQGGQSHRQLLEARLCVLVEHLSRLVHDLEPAVLQDGCVHIMLQEAFQKTGGGLQRAPFRRLVQAQLLELLR